MSTKLSERLSQMLDTTQSFSIFHSAACLLLSGMFNCLFTNPTVFVNFKHKCSLAFITIHTISVLVSNSYNQLLSMCGSSCQLQSLAPNLTLKLQSSQFSLSLLHLIKLLFLLILLVSSHTLQLCIC